MSEFDERERDDEPDTKDTSEQPAEVSVETPDTRTEAPEDPPAPPAEVVEPVDETAEQPSSSHVTESTEDWTPTEDLENHEDLDTHDDLDTTAVEPIDETDDRPEPDARQEPTEPVAEDDTPADGSSTSDDLADDGEQTVQDTTAGDAEQVEDGTDTPAELADDDPDEPTELADDDLDQPTELADADLEPNTELADDDTDQLAEPQDEGAAERGDEEGDDALEPAASGEPVDELSEPDRPVGRIHETDPGEADGADGVVGRGEPLTETTVTAEPEPLGLEPPGLQPSPEFQQELDAHIRRKEDRAGGLEAGDAVEDHPPVADEQSVEGQQELERSETPRSVEIIDESDELAPPATKPFRPGVDLAPDTDYVVTDRLGRRGSGAQAGQFRGIFHTDDAGRISEVTMPSGSFDSFAGEQRWPETDPDGNDTGRLSGEIHRFLTPRANGSTLNPDLNNTLLPDATYHVDGRFHFTTDQNSRVTHVRVDDVVMPEKGTKPPPNSNATRTTGQKGGPGYDGGHNAAAEQNGPNERINLTPMLETLNRPQKGGTPQDNFRSLEIEIARLSKDHRVGYTVTQHYQSDSSAVPHLIQVDLVVDGLHRDTYRYTNVR